MIDFRYHLVTIIAIFLALAVGIVVGTSALNGAVVANLHHNVARLQAQGDRLQSQNDAAAARLALGDSFARAVEPQLVHGRLAGRRVALVGLPGADPELLAAAAELLAQAGAAVAVEVRLTAALVDPAEQPLVEVLSQDLVPPGVHLASGTPVEHAAQVLAGALVGDPAGALLRAGTGVQGGAGTGVLTGFASDGLLNVVAAPTGRRPTMALLVAGAPPAAATAAGGGSAALLAAQVAVALAQDCAAGAAATVVAGPQAAAGAGGLVAAVRADAAASSVVATVDGLDTPIGEVATVDALQAAASGEVGGYGTSPGDTPLPPQPSPGASPGASPG